MLFKMRFTLIVCAFLAYSVVRVEKAELGERITIHSSESNRWMLRLLWFSKDFSFFLVLK